MLKEEKKIIVQLGIQWSKNNGYKSYNFPLNSKIIRDRKGFDKMIYIKRHVDTNRRKQLKFNADCRKVTFFTRLG